MRGIRTNYSDLSRLCHWLWRIQALVSRWQSSSSLVEQQTVSVLYWPAMPIGTLPNSCKKFSTYLSRVISYSRMCQTKSTSQNSNKNVLANSCHVSWVNSHYVTFPSSDTPTASRRFPGEFLMLSNGVHDPSLMSMCSGVRLDSWKQKICYNHPWFYWSISNNPQSMLGLVSL